MVENLIAGYLVSGRRLVIPDLGAFLKKESGETVFVEFLKKDDGVLSGLVAKSMEINALEAAGMVLQFSGDVKTSLGAKGFYIIPNVGTLRRDNTGNLTLSTNTESPEVIPQPAPTPVTPSAKQQEPAPRPATEPQARPQIPEQPRPVQPPRPTPVAVPAERPAAKPSIQDAPPVQKPKPVIENYTPGMPDNAEVRQRIPRPAPAAAPKNKKTDLIMIIAVAAALIAIGSMIFGLMVDSNPVNNIQPTQSQYIDSPVNETVEITGEQ